MLWWGVASLAVLWLGGLLVAVALARASAHGDRIRDRDRRD